MGELRLNPNLRVWLKDREGNFSHSKPVAAWDEDGDPYVIHESELFPAKRFANYGGLTLPNELLGVLPGAGYKVTTESDEGEIDVIAWVVERDDEGHVAATPVTVQGDETVTYTGESLDYSEIFCPGSKKDTGGVGDV
ncbi:hypothetical protein ABZ172_11980 [Streptomyces sp. NPDC006296]|uniref:hypothetical protein n=1 Tax=Streptomyces sp. NPDC006296 TaxID=3156746 RepID=UPI0033AE46C5